MKKNWIFFILLALFVLLLAGGSMLYKTLSADMEIDSLVTREESIQPDPQPPVENESSFTESPSEPIEDELPLAPDFTVYDKDGNEVHLSDFLGKPVVINFWATWCTYCKMHMPVFEEAYQTYGEDIHFLMINLTDGSRDTVESASAYIEEQGYTFPVYYDKDYSAAATYGASSIPITFFIDAEGHGIVYGRGALDEETFQECIDMIYTP